jgi:hypothetical protein
MAARINKRHQDMVREKIRASQLVNRLENHVLDDVEMSASQVNAALGLLRKVIPDLKVQELDLGDSQLVVNLVSQVDGSQSTDN